MLANPDEVLQAAFNLSETDRLALANELLATLPEHLAPDVDDPQFLEELERRNCDGTQAVSYLEAIAELRNS